jgi:hypothetical protein
MRDRLVAVPLASADDVAQIIDAVADLLWPVLAFVAVILFRSELASMSKRIRRLRAGNVEAELDQALDRLQASAEQAEQATPPAPVEAPMTVELEPAEEREEALSVTPSTDAEADEAERILERAAESPRAALMLLAAEIERKAREVLSTRIPDATGAPFHRQLQLLEVSPTAQEAALMFRDVRNRIVHGGVATADERYGQSTPAS